MCIKFIILFKVHVLSRYNTVTFNIAENNTAENNIAESIKW